MKDPAVIEETTSTSPTDRDPGDDAPVADVLADAAELHREADAAEGSATPTEALTEDAAPDPVEAVVETTVTEAPAEEAAAEESVVEEVAAPVIDEPAAEEPAVQEPVAEIAEPVVEVEAAVEEPVVEVAAAEAAAVEEAPPADDPFGGPGEWYVVHTYAGYENKVKTNLESRIHTMQMEDKIFRVHIPMEDVMEIKSGKKQVVQKKVFPGYLLVKMWYDNDSWYVVRNTPGVTGFVSSGTGSKPTPLSKREIDKILVVKKEEVKPQFRLGFEEGDVVRIISGPFADFNGTINEINVDQSKLKVLVNIFDRETPVELGFDQVSKV
jgi:transcription termination/antitermination protein NusG